MLCKIMTVLLEYNDTFVVKMHESFTKHFVVLASYFILSVNYILCLIR